MEETSSNHDGALWLKETIAIACRALLRLVAELPPVRHGTMPAMGKRGAIDPGAGSDVACRRVHVLHPATGPFAACGFPFRSGR